MTDFMATETNDYALSKRLQKFCERLENQMVSIRHTKMDKVFKFAFHKDAVHDMWNNRLEATVTHLSEDLKQWPQLRGGLVVSLVCGDVEAIEKAYRDITLPQHHHLSVIPGFKINITKGISCERHETTKKKLESLFCPILMKFYASSKAN